MTEDRKRTRRIRRQPSVERAVVAFSVTLVAACGGSANSTNGTDSGSDVAQTQPDAHTTSDSGHDSGHDAGHDAGQDSGHTVITADARPGDTGADVGTTHDTGVDSSPAPTCTDGIMNGNETGIDCGGGTCPACADTKGCKVTTDCLSGVCTADVCAAPACAPSCPDMNACGANGDCASGVCTAGKCGSPACSPTCATGADCALGTDCASGVCDATKFTCDAPTCTDGVKNGTETAIDCGGGTCPACGDTKACEATTDCESGVCTNNKCAAPACAPTCPDMNPCGANADCASAVCTSGECAAPACSPTCGPGAACDLASDCASGVCTANVCAPPACAPTCPDTNACGASTDCGSQVCTAGVCVPPVCSPMCAAAAACGGNADCASFDCAAGVCVNPVSCSALHTANPTLPSGAYTISPVGAAGPFTAYCDMTDNGGGWTLVLKIAGTNTSQATQNFTYAGALWTNTTLLDPTSTDLSQNEAKFQSYLSVPFTSILGMMTGATATNTLVIPAADTNSLSHLIINTASNTLYTNLGRAAWLGFTNPASVVQANCNADGINLIPVTGAACVGAQLSNSARIRIGFLANQENDCCSPDSFVGFGGDYYYNPGCGGDAPSAGSLGGSCYGGGASVYDFGYLFVR